MYITAVDLYKSIVALYSYSTIKKNKKSSSFIVFLNPSGMSKSGLAFYANPCQ